MMAVINQIIDFFLEFAMKNSVILFKNKHMKEEITSQVNAFFENHDNDVFRSSQFSDYLQKYNPLQKIFDFLYERKFKLDDNISDSQFIRGLVDESKNYLMINNFGCDPLEESALVEFYKYFFEICVNMAQENMSDEQRIIFHELRQMRLDFNEEQSELNDNKKDVYFGRRENANEDEDDTHQKDTSFNYVNFSNDGARSSQENKESQTFSDDEFIKNQIWEIADPLEDVFNIKKCSIESVEKVIDAWKRERESYPGWYIIPHEYFNKLGWINNKFSCWLQSDFNLADRDLEFCYEYTWRMEKGMLLFNERSIDGIYNIWKKHSNDIENDTEKIGMWFDIGMVLLRECRENGNTNEWHTIFSKIKTQKCISEFMNFRLDLENIKYAFSNFDMNKVRRLSGRISLPSDTYDLRLMKYGIDIECGNIEEATEHIKVLRNDLNEAINICSDNTKKIHLESIYVVVLHMMSYLLQALSYKNDRHKDDFEPIKNIEEEIVSYKSVFNWDEIKRYIQQCLLEWHIKRDEDTVPFSLSQKKITVASSANICEESYYLYRILDSTSLPLIIFNVNFLGNIEKPWLESLQEINPNIALFMMLRSRNADAIKSCYKRCNLWSIDDDIIIKQAQYLMNVFENNIDEMSEQSASIGVCTQLRNNLPTALVQCMSFCPDDMQCKALLLLKKIMEQPGLELDQRIDIFIHDMMMEISEKNKALMIGEMLDTKIIEHPVLYGSGRSVDLFDFYFRKKNIRQYNKLMTVKQETIEYLLKDDSDSKYIWRTKIMRLITLDDNNLLDKAQKKELTNKIWSRTNKNTGLPDLPDLYIWYYMTLDYDNSEIQVEQIKLNFLNNGMMKLFKNEGGCQITDGHIRYLEELIIASDQLENNFWIQEDVEVIYNDALQYWEILKNKLQSVKFQSQTDEYSKRANKMLEMMAKVYRNSPIELNESLLKKAKALIQEAKAFNIETTCLEILFAEDTQKTLIVEQLLDQMYSSSRQQAVDALNTAYTIIEYSPHEELALKLLDGMINILRFRKNPGLETALIMLHNLLYIKSPILTVEILRSIDATLPEIEKMTRYSNFAFLEKDVKNACLTRKACISLAYQLSLHEECQELPGVKCWESVCKDREFNDVKNEMLI